MRAILEKRRQEGEKKDRIKAAILAFFSFVGVVLACFFLVAFTKTIPPPGEQFVAVGFADIGDVAEAAGEVESEVPSETVEEVVQPEVSQSEPVESAVGEEVVTQEQSDVSVTTSPEPVTEPDPEPEPERTVDSRLSNAFSALAQRGGGGV